MSLVKGEKFNFTSEAFLTKVEENARRLFSNLKIGYFCIYSEPAVSFFKYLPRPIMSLQYYYSQPALSVTKCVIVSD